MKKSESWLRLLLSPFLAGEDIPHSATEFADKVASSGHKFRIFIVLSVFWISFFSLTLVSIIYFSSNNTLFNVTAQSEVVSIEPFSNQKMPPWELEQAEIFDDCSDSIGKVSGVFEFTNQVFVEFQRIQTGSLEITLTTDELDTVGKVIKNDRSIIELSDCVVIRYGELEDRSYTFAFDGVVTVGSELKEAQLRAPLLLSGSVSIADKGALSNEYYLADSHSFDTGDIFRITSPSTQSSGFIMVNEEPSMTVTYRGKGEYGSIERYKSESIVLNNSVWVKFFNDETLVIFWLLFVGLYTGIKTLIRFSIT